MAQSEAPSKSSSMAQVTSRTLTFENARFVQSLFANDLSLLRELRDQLDVKVTTRDTWIKIEGSEDAIGRAQTVFANLEAVRRKGLEINPQAFHYAVRSARAPEPTPNLNDLTEIRLLLGGRKEPVSPKTGGQLAYLRALESCEVVFGIGPAGTGKTYLAVASAIQALKEKKVERIILTRPAVEAGEALGFLPGDLQEKIFPYLRPLYDAIHEMCDRGEVERWIDHRLIEIAPLAYMRGRTLNRAFVILDEAQNTTCEQMFMFLTRMGSFTRCAITGDPSQSDLKRGVRSGLHEAMEALKNVKGVEFCHLTGEDVVRHPVVQRIIAAYAEHRSQPSGRTTGEMDKAC